MSRTTLIVVLCLLPGVTRAAVAQSLAPEGAKTPAQASLNIAGKAGGKTIQASGSGACRHAADSTIRGVSASLWTVQYGSGSDGPVKQLDLTLWRPKDGGPDQLSLSLETKGGKYRIETGPEGKQQGEGTVTILPSGPGGRLELTGKDGKGKPIQISIDCPAFGDGEADGS
jgi:hypothetical protein